MLELNNIRKEYPAGDGKVEALKGVNLKFRRSEFVSILGPSGCGKTTMLNIMGGLDQYTSGDLIINGRSTKNFKDRDWDGYRNHSVGFVFQSYNLIPHQTVLQNVELALTLSGVSKHERRKRAKEALEKVGLTDQLHKRPNQMSGGQMQRVAIARAIVNDPDIILADEPTGALDTQTSLQVMDILREIAKDRLVVMVTHNPDLAQQYSTRIVRMLDGELVSDSAPLTAEELEAEKELEKQKSQKKSREKKPSMSLRTSFGLSLRNLISKKGRTMLTSFAGSIGIIGIALIYAVSQGMTTYINLVQEETLSSYPLTIQAESVNIGSLMQAFIGQAQSRGEHENDAVYQKTMFYDMVNALNSMETTTNDLKAFKQFVEAQRKDPNSQLAQALNGVQYTYDLDMLVYTKNVDGTVIQADTQQLLQELLIEYFGMNMSATTNMSESNGMGMGSMMMAPGSTSAKLFQEMLPGDNGKPVSELLENQYDVIYGSWPNSYDEIVLVVDENNEIDDMTLYALGLKSKEEIDALANAAFNKTSIEAPDKNWSFEEICSLDFRVVFNANRYTLDEATGLYTDLAQTQAGLKYLYDNGLDLHITGIIRPKEDASATMLSSTLAYTSKLTEYVIEESKNSPAILAQLAAPETDIFTDLPFRENTGNLTDAEKKEAFIAYIAQLSDEQKARAYIKIKCIPSQQELEAMMAQAMEGQTRETMEQTMLQIIIAQTGMSESEMQNYLAAMTDEDMEEMYTQMVEQQVKMQYAAGAQQQMAGIPAQQLVAALTAEMEVYTDTQYAQYHDEVLEFSDSTYEDNLLELGYLDLASPASVNLYASSFESKDNIEAVIAAYNADKDEMTQIKYTDYIGLIMSSVTSIIDAITYVLIAFVAVSLVVSSIMIGVITLISVQERTKEIGVLRAIGASKKNVSSMFNAETVMIGFAAGAIGVLVTVLLCLPINAILHQLTGINNLSAYLPWSVGLVLIAISVLLTMLAGVIPARSAAKKDPVVALRTE